MHGQRERFVALLANKLVCGHGENLLETKRCLEHIFTFIRDSSDLASGHSRLVGVGFQSQRIGLSLFY
jgi:hypothetical protein